MCTLKKIDRYLNENDAGLKKLEQMLKNYDWWYTMTEDPKVRKKGEKQRKEILDLVDKLDGGKPGKAKYLYLKYANKNTGLTPEAERELKKLEKEV